MENQVVDRLTNENLVAVDSLKELTRGYILNCRCEGKSPKTVKFYHDNLNHFLWYAKQQGYPENPNRISPNHIRAFLTYVGSEPVRWGATSTTACRPTSQITVRHYYRVLFTFFKWLKEEEIISDNPVAHLKTPKIEQKVIQALSRKDVEALLNKCPAKTMLGVRNRAIILMLLDSGMRVSELSNLRLTDLDRDTGAIMIKHGKGNKQRIVRIGSTSQKALWRYLTLYRRGDSDRLFLTKTSKPLQAEAIELIVRRLGKKANLSGIHIHRLRHTFAINYLRNGGDIFSLKYLLGHSSLTMVQNYLASLDAEDAAKCHSRVSPVDRLFD